MKFSDSTVLSVKALNEFVKRVLDNNNYLSSVNIRGEISNFINHQKSGHLYFSVKDEDAQVRCVMFSAQAAKLKPELKDGMKVKVHGRVSMFVRDGQFIFYADRLEADGVGDLYQKFEDTKIKLEKEGLFNRSHKKPIPKYPSAIGIITSENGAAVQDIKNVIFRRYPMVQLILYPSLVQGSGAEDELCQGIEYFSKERNVDTVIIGRGGGSFEDLVAFNSEKLARMIYSCPIPVISAVGHETDFTISDFVSDLRAPTPSAAAELAVPECRDLKRQLANVTLKLQYILSQRILAHRTRLESLSKHRLLQSPKFLIDDKRLYVDRMNELMCLRIKDGYELSRRKISNIQYELSANVNKIYNLKKQEYISLTSKLTALNPMAVISRGYSAVFDENGNVIRDADDVCVGDNIEIKMKNGNLKAEVTDKR